MKEWSIKDPEGMNQAIIWMQGLIYMMKDIVECLDIQ